MKSSIGEGLFTSKTIKVGDIIDFFNGIIITHNEAITRTKNNMGGYIIYINKDWCMDCYETCKMGECLASKSNNSLRLTNKFTGTKAITNAKLFVFNYKSKPYSNKHNFRVYLRAIKEINCHQEVCYAYGKKYTKYNTS